MTCQPGKPINLFESFSSAQIHYKIHSQSSATINNVYDQWLIALCLHHPPIALKPELILELTNQDCFSWNVRKENDGFRKHYTSTLYVFLIINSNLYA